MRRSFLVHFPVIDKDNGHDTFALDSHGRGRQHVSVREVLRMKFESAPNKITGANAGGRCQLRIRTCWAVRVAQFGR